MPISVTVCYFRREKDSDVEYGIMIDDDKLIIDANGVPVKGIVWSYALHREMGCVIFNLPKGA